LSSGSARRANEAGARPSRDRVPALSDGRLGAALGAANGIGLRAASVKGIILAAGFGTRLAPLARDRAKPLLRVGGRPAVDHVLERLAEAPSVGDVTVVVNGRFEDEFRAWSAELPQGLRGRVGVVSDGAQHADERLGAVRDLRLGTEAFSEGGGGEGGEDGAVSPGDEGWVVAAGDNLFAFSVEELVATLRASSGTSAAAAALAVEAPAPAGERAGKGLACVDAEGRVTAFEEKPAQPRCDRPVAAVYAFGPGLPTWIGEFLKEGGDPDAPGYLIEWLVGRLPVTAHEISGYRFDIGTPERLRRARAFFAGRGEGPSERRG